jgi:hypothetical protein
VLAVPAGTSETQVSLDDGYYDGYAFIAFWIQWGTFTLRKGFYSIRLMVACCTCLLDLEMGSFNSAFTFMVLIKHIRTHGSYWKIYFSSRFLPCFSGSHYGKTREPQLYDDSYLFCLTMFREPMY